MAGVIGQRAACSSRKINSPVEASRAEIQFDGANIIRLGANSSIRIGDLQYHRYLVQINQGTTLFRVLSTLVEQVCKGPHRYLGVVLRGTPGASVNVKNVSPNGDGPGVITFAG